MSGALRARSGQARDRGMRRIHLVLLVAIVGLVAGTAAARAQAPSALPRALEGVDIVEHLGGRIPLDGSFFDEDSQTVRLGDYFHAGRPVVLTLNYYECPMLCTLILNGLVATMQKMDWTPGKQYEIVTVSFNPAEGPTLASAKKESYIESYGHDDAAKSWHFLTGRQESIHALTEAVGFHYRWDEEHKQFLHQAAIFVVTPDGRLSRYLYGVNFDPSTLKMSLLEAAGGKIGSPLNQIIMYCYQYDPKSGGYSLVALRVMQIGAGLFGLALAGFLSALWIRGRRAQHV